jgi:antitoxin Phd
MEVTMHIWQLQEAKAKLTALINNCRQEPQFISRHGISEAVVISMEKYRELTGQNENLVSFLRHSPLYGVELDLERDKSPMRDTDL